MSPENMEDQLDPVLKTELEELMSWGEEASRKTLGTPPADSTGSFSARFSSKLNMNNHEEVN